MSEENTTSLARWEVGNVVTSIAVSRDGTRVISGSADKYVRVWDVRTGALVLGPLKGHTDWVRSVAFSPDDNQIASGSDDYTVRIWDAHTGNPKGEPLKGHTGWIRSVAFSHDRTRIVSGSDDRTIGIWDARIGTLICDPLKGHASKVWSVSFSHDNTLILSGSSDNTIRIWSAHTGTPIGQPFKGHTGLVLSVAFSHDSARIVSGSRDHTIRIWDARTGTPIGEPLEGHTNDINSVAFSLDSTRIVSGSDDRTIRIWDARTGTPIGEPLKGHTEAIWSVVFSPDSTRIFSGSKDGTIGVWLAPQISPSSDMGTIQLIDSSPTPACADMASSTTPIQKLPTAQVDDNVASKEAPQEVPSFDMVSSSMSAQEMFECLVRHGCTDLTSSTDAERRSSSVIASGGFGDVRRVKLDDGSSVAVKTLRLHILLKDNDKGVKRAVREVYVWSRLHHPNIQELLGIIVFQGGLGMVSPWMTQGNLQQYIIAHPNVERYPLCVQLLSGVSYLHRIKIVHGDLKANNVLVSDDGTLKINDFDHAILSDATLRFSTTTRPGGGTLRWMAPELLQPEAEDEEGESHALATRSKQTDIYAVGMTILEIFTGNVPYNEYQSDMGVYGAIYTKKPPRRPKELSRNDVRAVRIWELLLSCWDHDPSARPDAASVLTLLQSLAA